MYANWLKSVELLGLIALIIKITFLPLVVAMAETPNQEKTFKILEKVAQLDTMETKNTNIDIEIGLSNSEKKIQEQRELAKIKEQALVASQVKLAVVKKIRYYSAGSSGNTEIDQLIDRYANVNGISEKIDLVKRIIYCESKGDPNAKNQTSSAGGLAQYLDRSWASTVEGQQGLSKYDPDAAISAMTRDVAQGNIGKWNASRGCW